MSVVSWAVPIGSTVPPLRNDMDIPMWDKVVPQAHARPEDIISTHIGYILANPYTTTPPPQGWMTPLDYILAPYCPTLISGPYREPGQAFDCHGRLLTSSLLCLKGDGHLMLLQAQGYGPVSQACDCRLCDSIRPGSLLQKLLTWRPHQSVHAIKTGLLV